MIDRSTSTTQTLIFRHSSSSQRYVCYMAASVASQYSQAVMRRYGSRWLGATDDGSGGMVVVMKLLLLLMMMTIVIIHFYIISVDIRNASLQRNCYWWFHRFNWKLFLHDDNSMYYTMVWSIQIDYNVLKSKPFHNVIRAVHKVDYVPLFFNPFPCHKLSQFSDHLKERHKSRTPLKRRP